MDDTTRRLNDGESRARTVAAEKAAAEADVDRHSEQIRAEIEHTREEMAETIGAIQEKLRPRTVLANATERIKTATTERAHAMADYAGDAVHTAMDRTRETAGGFMASLRENPIPAALIGVGVAWLMTNASRSRQSDRWYRPGDGSGWRRLPLREDQGYLDTEEGRSAPGFGRRFSDTAEGLTDRARGYARDASQTIRRTVQRAGNQMMRTIDDNPLLVGAGALLLGVAFGLAVPETERENEWMGETRDSVVDRAQELVSNTSARVQQAAGEIADAAGSVADSTADKNRT